MCVTIHIKVSKGVTWYAVDAISNTTGVSHSVTLAGIDKKGDIWFPALAIRAGEIYLNLYATCEGQRVLEYQNRFYFLFDFLVAVVERRESYKESLKDLYSYKAQLKGISQ